MKIMTPSQQMEQCQPTGPVRVSKKIGQGLQQNLCHNLGEADIR